MKKNKLMVMQVLSLLIVLPVYGDDVGLYRGSDQPLRLMETHAMVKKPMTPMALLENIKLAIDQHLLLREDFYTENNLKQFSGASAVYWLANDIQKKWGSLDGFSGMVEPVVGHNYVLSDVSFLFRRTAKEDGTIEGRMTLQIRDDARLRFKEIEKNLRYTMGAISAE